MTTSGSSSAPRLSRRSFLTGAGLLATGVGATALGVSEGALPGRSWLYRHLGPSGGAGAIPDISPGETVSGNFASAARRGQTCGWSIAYPPGTARALPVAVVLHGRGADHTSAFSSDYLGLDRFLAAGVAAGAPPLALASVDGGDTYWHARSTGEDAAAMVVDEFLPLLADRDLDASRIGLLGWSMGGYGALALAGRLGLDRVAAVTAVSPALWREYDDTAAGAFDDEADFAEATVFGRQPTLDGIPVRVDCGMGDPFYAATSDYLDDFDVRPAGGFEPGNHDLDYWRRIAPQQLQFLASALAGRRNGTSFVPSQPSFSPLKQD